MNYAAMIVTALVGASLALQIGLNATMSQHVGSPTAAALVNFAVGTLVLFLIVLLGRGSLPMLAQAGGAPWWAWGGGLLGACFVAASTAFGPMIGGAAFLALLVAGQMIAALAIDHYGVLGFPVRSVDGWRIAGALLVVAGVFLLTRR
ncbi:MAG: DMT family transporter [Gammaproteobacteria bacterium]|nr:DMT family transporter [Gammaproteobacteria bacterium]